MSLDPSKYSQNQIESSTRKRFALMDEFISNMPLKSTAATTGIGEFSGAMPEQLARATQGKFTFSLTNTLGASWRNSAFHDSEIAFDDSMVSMT